MKLDLAFRSSASGSMPKVKVVRRLGIDGNVVPFPSRAESELARSVLIGKSARISGVFGSVHPFEHPGEVHPAHIESFSSLIGKLLSIFSNSTARIRLDVGLLVMGRAETQR